MPIDEKVWIGSLFEKIGHPVVVAPREETVSNLQDDTFDQAFVHEENRFDPAIKVFLEGNVAFKDQAYQFCEQTLTESQLLGLIQVLRKFHFDGRLHIPDLVAVSASPLKSISMNFYPKSLFLQLVTLLENTAILSAIWEKKADFNPNDISGMGLYLAIALFSYASCRNVHYYASILNGFSADDIRFFQEKARQVKEDFILELRAHHFNDTTIFACLNLVTLPSRFSRIEQDFLSFCLFSIKLCAAAALFFAELPALPIYLQLVLTAFAGMIQGIDTAFTQVAIGNENQDLIDVQRGITPPKNIDRSYLFPKMADFSLIPWTMAKVGPLMWLVVKTRAAMTFANLASLNSNEIPGGLYGLYGVAAISSVYVSAVFSLYNVAVNLGHELPTHRTFDYADAKRLRFLQALLGALPAAGIAGSAPYLMAQSLRYAIVSCFSVELITALAITFSKGFTERYRYLSEFRFGADMFSAIDRWHQLDKAVLFFAGVALSAIGILQDVRHGVGEQKQYQAINAVGMILCFFMGTGLVSGISRSVASQLRYGAAQMFLYAAALLTWVLNCAISMGRVLDGKDAKDRPGHINTSHFGQAGYYAFMIGSLMIGFMAGSKDAVVNAPNVRDAEGVSVLTAQIPEAEKKGSVCLRLLQWVSCRSHSAVAEKSIPDDRASVCESMQLNQDAGMGYSAI